MDVLEKIYNDIEIKKEEPTETDASAEGEAVETEPVENEEENEESGGIQEFNVYPIIKSASVDTKGADFGIPETEEAFDYNEYINNYFMQQYGGQ